MDNNWISVKDRLPEGGQKVLLWLVPNYKFAYSMQWTWEKDSTAEITINGDKVTHWQPLEPPKQ